MFPAAILAFELQKWKCILQHCKYCWPVW